MGNASLVYDTKYFTKEVAQSEELLRGNKLNISGSALNQTLIVKEIPYDKPVSLFKENNITLIMEKIGQKILSKHEDNSLLNTLNSYRPINGRSVPSIKLMKFNSSKSESSENAPPQAQASEKNNVVLVHLSNEEDITFLLNVYYYWEELHPTFTADFPKTVEEYLAAKETKSRRESEMKNLAVHQNNITDKNAVNNATTQPPPNYSHKIFEKIFMNLPEFNNIEEEEESLPLGWQFNYLGLFNESKINRPDPKYRRVRGVVRRAWANANLSNF